MPNPWDAGTAKYLSTLGFPALATTSAGAANSMGYPDGGVTLDEMIAHLATIVSATVLPVNADFEHGYSHGIDEMVHNMGAVSRRA